MKSMKGNVASEKQNRTICVLSGNARRKNVYADDILSGIQKVAKKKRIEVAIASSVNELIALCKKHGEKTAAVICYSKAIALEIVEKLHRENIHPILTYIHTLDTAYPYSCVVQDYACSFHRLLSAAIKSGVKRIAFVGSNEDSFSDSVRKNILLKTAREQGLYCKIFQNNGDVGGCIGEFLAEAEDFDSIVCANDIVAVLLSARLENGEKYDVIGFGGMQIGKNLFPSFSSVLCDFYAVSENVIETYLLLEKTEKLQSVKMTVGSELILSEKLARADMAPVSDKSETRAREAANDFYSSADVEELNRLENMFLSADRLDLTILKSVLNNEKYANIEEENYLAINTIKYRMNNMIKNAGVKNRKELLDLIGKYNLKF